MVIKFGVLIFSFVLWCIINAELTPDFHDFISKNYGNGVAVSLDRLDMGSGTMGSFGGKKTRNEKIRNRVRNFIKAVYDYTNSQVVVMGYSMGVAITRKAILGGYCVDTNEYLGKPLTNLVETYIAVAGVAYGLEKCTPNFHACNVNNGMYCGSDYMRDLNRQKDRYEGKYSYYIFSESDYVIGKDCCGNFYCCGNFCPELKNAYGVSAHQTLDHGTALTMTKDIQLAMIKHENFDHIVPSYH
uniref:Uncharacterized protein n=1 Tax=Panagrolaimus sp. ES5 TaxID=591445 RepID=A0AC34FHZ5_9BILA